MPKASTSQSTAAPKPYDRSSKTPPSDDDISHGDASSPKKGRTGGSAGDKDKYRFSRVVLVTLMLAPVKPDWDSIGQSIGKTKSQTYDVWRKSLLPNLLSNKPWSTGSTAESKEMRIGIMLAVLEGLKPDWTALTEYFPGRTKSQINDMWRKSIAPRLKKGDTIE